MIHEYKIGFWNINQSPKKDDHIFGCSALEYATCESWINPTEKNAAFWSKKLIGQSITGSYGSVLKSLSHLEFKPKLCLAFFNKDIGTDEFVNKFSAKFRDVQIIGGGAARASGQAVGELIPSSEDVSVLAVSEGDFQLQSFNLYGKTNISVEIKKTSNREFEWLRVLPDGDWQSAREFYQEQQIRNKIDQSNFELMPFIDNNNLNLHCSTDGKALKTGANLPENNILHLGLTTYHEAEKNLFAFIAEENSLIFGCAGVRSLISNPIKTGKNSLAGFLFGELITINGKALFGNLMLGKLTFQK